MLWKLSFTGLKSRFKDYAVLFSGLTLSAAVFYMFLTLALNPSFLKKNLVIAFQTTQIVFGVGIVLLSLITLVYVVYANSFLLSMRKHDYGIYMMLGARNSKIGRLIFTETLIIGILATMLGEIIGIFLTQGVSTLLVNQLGLKISKFVGIYIPALIWTLVFFVILFFLAAIWNSIKLRKTKVIDLVHEDQTPVKLAKHPVWRGIEAISGIVLLALGYWSMANYKELKTNSIFIGFVTITLGSYFLFASLSTTAIAFLERQHTFSYKKLRVFTLGQLKFRIHDYNRILTVVSLLFALALGAITVGLNFSNLTDQTMKANYYDVVLFNKNKTVDKKLKEVNVQQKTTLDYKVLTQKQKGTDDKQIVYVSSNEIDKDKIKIQNYNMKEATPSYTTITLTTKNLNQKDEVKRYSLQRGLLSLLPVSFDADLKIVSQKEFNSLKFKEEQVDLLLVNDFKKNFNNIESLQQAALPQNISSEMKDILLTGTKSGSYRPVLMIASGFEFMGFFLGIAFLAMLASTLMFKVLSGAGADKPRYKMLWKMGTQKKLLKKSISQEIGVLFALPAILGIVDVLFGLQFFKSLLSNPYDKIWIPFTIFLVLYFLYYLITVKLYEGIVLEKD
ncbi:FtsX-like permease family protein [Lactobacillus sp. LL6]|uniref:FtsX-like permease family protein n=1 Tax=Lactobacillus sp. LL6 TaxID=2596827 RepID=UPI0011851AA9|nr:FtsX-like permease family protein [Lactobacillus sp. LL6]TSO26846.1 FtsX-like permease family protein [Lactobacillus sp. LL6]